MKPLDRTQPFAQIFGDDLGRAYEQDGQFFRGDGSLWTESGDAPAPAPAKPAKKSMSKTAPEAEPAPVADDAQLQTQLADKPE